MSKQTYQYWLKSARLDLKTARNLFQHREYPWTLFIGHLTLEKLLKAYYTKFIDPKVPYRHNLLLLTKECKLKLSEKQTQFFDEISLFNIATRYPDVKFLFYKKCTENFTRKYLEKIVKFAEWLTEQIENGP
ncbi:MAG: HEPN domain-containing protein [Candidatus Omnitrophota bacterium]